jgi:arylamine N-acetyltransferase
MVQLKSGSGSMTGSSFDQQAWLHRIAYSGSLEPTLGTLDQLIFAHSHAITYESLDIMLGRTPRLDLASLQRKMISGGRGGYCLEQNMLFREGLRSLGYKITSLQGRVVRGMAIDAPSPAIHMLLQVDMPDGLYLADVGSATSLPHRLSCCEQDSIPKVRRRVRDCELVYRHPTSKVNLVGHFNGIVDLDTKAALDLGESQQKLAAQRSPVRRR